MTTTIRSQIATDLAEARKSKATALSNGVSLALGVQTTIDTLSLVSSLLTETETRKKHREALTDSEVVAALRKMIKQRLDVADQYDKAGRTESALTERAEARIIEKYVPQTKDKAETEKLVDQIISETGASSMSDMGKIMGRLSADDTIDKKIASQLVREKLSGN